MQISHVVCQGANTDVIRFLLKSARINSEVSAPKSHLTEQSYGIMILLIRLVWNSYSIPWLVNYESRSLKYRKCIFPSYWNQSGMSDENISDIKRNRLNFLRFKLVCSLTNHVPNLHYNVKTGMAAIVNITLTTNMRTCARFKFGFKGLCHGLKQIFKQAKFIFMA